MSIKNLFAKDFVLKMVSFVIAIAIWLYIIMILSPITETVVEGVQVQRQSNISDEFMILDKEIPTVDISLSGNRSDLQRYANKNNIRATVDLSTINSAGFIDLPVRIDLKEGLSVTDKEMITVRLEIAKVDTINDINVQVYPQGSVKLDYYPGPITLSPEKVTLVVPEEHIKHILEAFIDFDYAGSETNIKKNERILLKYKHDDGVVEAVNPEDYNISVKPSPTVTASCDVDKANRVSITATLPERDAAKYQAHITPSSVVIRGESQLVDSTISIATKPINVIGAQSYTVPLVFPEGISSHDGVTEVRVTLIPAPVQ